MKKNIIILILISILFVSCFKEDRMLPAHIPGDVTTVIIPMTKLYTDQFYYKLETNEIVASNDRSIFDLMFECGDSTLSIKLNTANFAMAGLSQFDKLEDVTDTIGLEWKFDNSNGDLDSLAINSWISVNGNDTTYSNNVWVINQGISAFGIQLGLKKIQFYDFKNNRYYFRFSDMDNSNLIEAYVEKNNDFGFVQYSMETANGIIQTEPEIDDWDILFTTFTTFVLTDEGIPYPYIVTGVLQNQHSTIIALDTNLVFSEINLSDTALFAFSTDLDKIGYDWKYPVGNVETGNFTYVTNFDNTYLIKDGKSYFYKLRFIDFYSEPDPETGNKEKGYPTFEYQRL